MFKKSFGYAAYFFGISLLFLLPTIKTDAATAVGLSGVLFNGSTCSWAANDGCSSLATNNTTVSINSTVGSSVVGTPNPATFSYGLGVGFAPGSSLGGSMTALPPGSSHANINFTCFEPTGGTSFYNAQVNSAGGAFSAPGSVPDGSSCLMSIDIQDTGNPPTNGNGICEANETYSNSVDCGPPTGQSQVSVSISPTEDRVTEGGSQYKVFNVTVNSGWGHPFNLSATCNQSGMSCHFYRSGSPVTECTFGQYTSCSPNTFFDQESHTGDTTINGSYTVQLHVRNYNSSSGSNLAASATPYPFSVSAQLAEYYENGNSNNDTIYCNGQCGAGAAGRLFVDPLPCVNFISGGPGRLSCDQRTSTSFRLNWTPGTWTGGAGQGQAGYTVTRTSANPNNLTSCPSGTICNNSVNFSTGSVVVSGLTPNTTYYNRVAQICNTSSGSYGGYKDDPDLTADSWTGNTSNNWTCSTTGGPCVATNFNDTTSGLTSGHVASVAGLSGSNTLTVAPNGQFTVACDFGVAPTNDISLPHPSCVWNGSLVNGSRYWYHCTAPSSAQTVNISCNINNDGGPDNFCAANGPTPAMALTVVSNVCTPNVTESQSCPGSNATCTGTQTRTCNASGSAWGAWSGCSYGTGTYASNGLSCTTGNSCTINQVCSAGNCIGGTTNTCTPNECQTASSCNGSGGCNVTNRPLGFPCTGGTCGNNNGVCVLNNCQAGTVQLSNSSISIGSPASASVPSGGWSNGSFSSQNPGVASVTSGGSIMGQSGGSTNIVGTATDPDGTLNCPLAPANITVNPSVGLPTVTTQNPVTNITQTTATGGGTVVANGGSVVTVSGITWSTSANPTTALSTKTTDGWAIGGPWNSSITGLSPNTLYHVRAYATNSAGTAYGADVTFTSSAASGCIAAGSGTGLTGSYFDGNALGTLVTTRLDSMINFNPADSLGNYANSADGDSFSVRWEGQVEPRCSENYTFYTNTDDGTRLWVNGVQVINQWVPQAPTEVTSAPIALAAGTKYNIRMEFFENGGGATAELRWSSPSTAKQIIPQTQLTPLAASAPNLVASPASPASATAGTPLTFSSTISNNGTVGTGASFSNFFQVATAANGGGTVTDLASASMSALAAAGSAPATSPSYTFGSVGTYSIRVCADKTNSSSVGVITESNEGDNCSSSWTNVTVNSGGCVANSDCSDGNSCTTDTCSAGVCSNTNSPVPGGWTVWGPCVGGVQSRTCTAPTQSCGGSPCSGASTQACVVGQHPVTVISSSCGTVTSVPAGISCGASCNQPFDEGTNITLTAVAKSQCQFVGWSGSCSGANPVCNLTVDGSKTVTPIFGLKPFFYQEF